MSIITFIIESVCQVKQVQILYEPVAVRYVTL